MKPLSERDENHICHLAEQRAFAIVGMKPLSERDENFIKKSHTFSSIRESRNEATL